MIVDIKTGFMNMFKAQIEDLIDRVQKETNERPVKKQPLDSGPVSLAGANSAEDLLDANEAEKDEQERLAIIQTRKIKNEGLRKEVGMRNKRMLLILSLSVCVYVKVNDLIAELKVVIEDNYVDDTKQEKIEFNFIPHGTDKIDAGVEIKANEGEE